MSRRSPFLDRLNALLEISDKTQKEIAEEIGYDKPNIISMFKQGITKVPLEKVPALAVALHADPAHMLRLALADYSPLLLKTLETALPVISANEKALLELHRQATHDHDPKLPVDFRTDYKALAKQHGLDKKPSA